VSTLIRKFASLVLAIVAGTGLASAQTTVVLSAPDTEVVDCFARAGSYANVVNNNTVLVTKMNSSASFVRRAFLKFDTENSVPANSTIQSATLTLTLKSSEADTRTLGAYRLSNSFEETGATWNNRQASTRWTTAGGDLGSKYAEAVVSPTPGTRVTFDLTTLVQETVNGTYDSRFTQLALVDLGTTSPASFKEFYSSEDTDATVRPQLTVVYDPPPPPVTTVVLAEPDTEVADAFARGGSYANTVNDTNALVTKMNSTASFVRRSFLEFKTENRIPAHSAIRSATLALTLKSSETDTRTIGAFSVTNTFDEFALTWNNRKPGTRWTTAGGDLGMKYAEAVVDATPGSRVTFDVTALVQDTVLGNFTTRDTRIALADLGTTSPASFKEFHSSEATDPAVRPQLTVVFEGPALPADPRPSFSGTLKVLHWNIHYGIGTDGAYGIDKHVDWIVQIDPDIVSLNEVEKNVPGHGNEDQPALFASKLTARTGQQWYYHHANRFGNWGANGGGNLILSRFPIIATSQLLMSYSRSAALATIVVDGRTLNFVSTHLASESSGYRSTQIQQLMPWLRGFSEQRIVAGDFNAGLVNVPFMATEYADGWTAADAMDTAQDYVGNTRYGATHDYKIDFIFRSKGAASLAVLAARVFDTRGPNGVMPSDHKPLLVTYSLQ
jgi:endonuclease/exonuclease/phosphatase family metal-dependent hydrolase